METFDLDPALFSKRGAGDDKLYVQFYPHIELDHAASTEAGRPVHRDAVYIRIVTPGDKTSIVDRPMRDSDKVRFPQQWQAYQNGAEGDAQTVGTRLAEWSLIPRSLAEDLKHQKILTVEQLATCRDDVLTRMPGLRDYQNAARIWLEKSEKTAESSKLAAALEEKDNQIAALNEALKDLQAIVKEMKTSKRQAAAA